MSLLPRKSPKVVSLKLPASVLVEMSDELLEICKQYGTIYQWAFDLSRDQLLVEVEEFSAMRLLNKFKRAPPRIGGYTVRVAPTTRQEMIRAQAESNEKTPPQKIPAERPVKHDFNPSCLRAENELTSTVLCAHVDKEIAEVKHDVLRQAFAKYGRVICLVSFRHKGTLHCLVQYAHDTNAGEGLRKLNGMHIYDGCCILRVSYSNLASLAFKDDGRGYKKLIHHNSQLELSKKTVDHLQVWYPNKGMEGNPTEQDRQKEFSKKVSHVKRNGTVCIDKMPRIPKLSAINSKHNTERQLQTCSANDSVESGSNPVKAVKPSKPLGSNKVSLKSSKPNHITSRPSHMSKSYYKISYTPVRPKVPSSSSKHSQKKTTKSASQVPSTTKKLPSQTSACDSTLQKHDVNKATDVAKIAASPVSRSDEKTSSNDALSNSDTTDRPCVTPDEGVGSDTNTFTLSLDPSDYSDVDTDASASSVSDSKRLPSFGCQPSPVQCQSVESAIGCQDVTLPSTSTQCVMEDDELKNMVISCQLQLAELKKQSCDVVGVESRNKQLLLENANLKKLLTDVQNEMRQLKEVINNVAPKVDASPNTQRTVAEDEVQKSTIEKCDKAQQTDQQTHVDSLKHSDGFTPKSSRKRSFSCNDTGQDTVYKPSKKKQKKKKSFSLTSLTPSPENNSLGSNSNGFAQRIRNKFLYTHLQSLLHSQEFIKCKLDAMKEAMKKCNADLHKLMSKVVSQFENMYEMTVKVANLEQHGNEDELFTYITELPGVFPSLIAGLSEGLSLKMPGVTLSILNVLRKMEYLATEMTKYIPQSKTLAYGNATTGETTSMESSVCSSNGVASPPPLLSLDEAVEMLDEKQHKKQQDSNNPLCLTISISTKLLHSIGGKQFSSIPNNHSSPVHETEDGGPSRSGGTQNEDQVENQDQETPASPKDLHNNGSSSSTVCNLESNDQSDLTDNPIDIEIVQNECYDPKSERKTSEDPSNDTSNLCGGETIDSSSEKIVPVEGTVSNGHKTMSSSVSTSVMQCNPAPPITSSIQTSTITPTCSANQNGSVTSNSPISESLPPFSSFPSNQHCVTSASPVQTSAPSTYNSNGYLFNQLPNTSTTNAGVFTPLLALPYIPTPIINTSRSTDGLVVKWTLEQPDIHLASQVHSYRLCVFQGDHAPAPDLWHTIGEVQAMKLPMACTLKYFEKGKTYHFAVRAINREGVCGQFSKSKIIQMC